MMRLSVFSGLIFSILSKTSRDSVRCCSQLKQCISRELDSVDPVERAILRLSTYELLFRPDVPPKVVLNEAIELSRVFGSEEGFRLVNGVLDALVNQKSLVEIRSGQHEEVTSQEWTSSDS